MEQYKISTSVNFDADDPRWLVNVNSPMISHEMIKVWSSTLFELAGLLEGCVTLSVADALLLENRPQYKD